MKGGSERLGEKPKGERERERACSCPKSTKKAETIQNCIASKIKIGQSDTVFITLS